MAAAATERGMPADEIRSLCDAANDYAWQITDHTSRRERRYRNLSLRAMWYWTEEEWAE